MNDLRHEISEEPQRAANAVIHAGFVLAGIVTTLLGPILPILIARRSLSDAHAGLFFSALPFGGSPRIDAGEGALQALAVVSGQTKKLKSRTFGHQKAAARGRQHLIQSSYSVLLANKERTQSLECATRPR